MHFLCSSWLSRALTQSLGRTLSERRMHHTLLSFILSLSSFSQFLIHAGLTVMRHKSFSVADILQHADGVLVISQATTQN